MKIAYILPALTPTGPINVAADLVQVMTAHGIECVVYYFDDTSNKRVFQCLTQKISFRNYPDLSNFDILHSHGLRPDLFVLFYKLRFGKVKTVTTIHNFVFQDLISELGPIKGLLGGLLWLIAWSLHNKYVVLSETAKTYYTKYLRKSKIEVAYNTRIINKDVCISAEDSIFFKELRRKYEVVCASICRVTNRKGLDCIISAMSQLNLPVCYVIIGDGPELKNLKEQALSMGVRDRVFFLGNKANGYAFLPYIDIFCIPSHSEGFPLAMLEAAFYEKAVVSSDIPVFREIFSEQEIVICEENNVESYVQGIIKAIEQKEALSRNIKLRFDKDYSPTTFYNNYKAIYDSLVMPSHLH